MSLDKNHVVLDDALKIARQYYDGKTKEKYLSGLRYLL